MHRSVRIAFCRTTLLLVFLLSPLSLRGLYALSLEPLHRAPEIRGKVWFNVEQYPRISLKSLQGIVILVIFWRSGDLSFLEPIERVKALRDRYKDHGFEVIGVHDSAWGVGESEAAVLNKIRELDIGFPIVMDTDASIWLAFGQKVIWPSLYLIDRKGYVRWQSSYDFSWKDAELMLQMLLEEGCSRQWERYERKGA